MHIESTALRIVIFLLMCVFSHFSTAQSNATSDSNQLSYIDENPLAPPDTSSPRATLKSFLTNTTIAWNKALSQPKLSKGLSTYGQRAILCLDLSKTPENYRSRRVEGVVLLLDVLNRVPLPDFKDIPDSEEVQRDELTRWLIPKTTIAITKVEEGPRAGEWLFSTETVDKLDYYYDLTRTLPLKADAVVEDGYKLFTSYPGWLVPTAWLGYLPPWSKVIYFGQTLWQWLSLISILFLAVATIWLVTFYLRRSSPEGSLSSWRGLALALTIVISTFSVVFLSRNLLNFVGVPFTVIDLLASIFFYLALAWSILRIGKLITNNILKTSANITIVDGVDAAMVRLVSRIVSIGLAVFILAYGAQRLGVPIAGVIAGLGIGGIAFALAGQNSIENFFGTIILFTDRPVSVGNFCKFGSNMGTVEKIGLRSTRVRTLNQTLLTIPNADFTRMEIDNYSLRTRRALRSKLHLSLETTPQQIQNIRAGIREALLSHPKVADKPARVELSDVGSYSIDISVFAFINVKPIGEFQAIRTQIFLKCLNIIEKAGTRLAPPVHFSNTSGSSDNSDMV
jgi:MscS family membrane protein